MSNLEILIAAGIGIMVIDFIFMILLLTAEKRANATLAKMSLFGGLVITPTISTGFIVYLMYRSVALNNTLLVALGCLILTGVIGGFLSTHMAKLNNTKQKISRNITLVSVFSSVFYIVFLNM